MLTTPLLRARVKDGKLRPSFVDPTSERLLERADALLAIYREGLGRKRAALDEEVTALIGDGTDKKLTDGLVKVLTDRCEFVTACPVEPVELRARIFALATELGPVAPIATEGGRPTAEELWARLGAELGHDPAALAASLYGDHPDEQVLASVDVDTGRALLDRYNVALVQTLLLQAAAVDVVVKADPPRLRQLLRAVKFHQLLFTATRVDGGLKLHIDGPASLFAQTTRYGLALAKFLPALLRAPAWSMAAEVRWGRFKPTLELSQGDGLHAAGPDAGAWHPKEVEWLIERFRALESGWTVETDVEPLLLGHDAVAVPDLAFRKEGRVAHLEVLGFWRKGTVPKRLAALKKGHGDTLIVAVSKRLCGEDDVDALPDQVIPFAEVIPAKEVLRRVEAVARR